MTVTTLSAPPPRAARTLPARPRPSWLLILLVVGIATALLWSPLPLEARMVAALLLFVALPGHLLVSALFVGRRPGPLERALLTLGIGYVLAMLLALVLYALFRPLTTPTIVVAGGLLNVSLLLVALARGIGRTTGTSFLPRLRRPSWAVLAVLLIAAPPRLANLGHSEFQGDEALVLLRTAALLQGVPDALIAHRKVPGEILLNALFTGGLGAIAEAFARLPFALAGVAGALAFYHLGRVMFGPAVGLVAGLPLAVSGYFVAFGRILQYQSLGFLLDTLAILCLFRFARAEKASRAYAVVGGLLLAGSALAGLNAVFLLPVAAVALWPRVVGPKRAAWRDLALWLWPLVPLLPLAVVVYVVLASGESSTLGLSSFWPYLGPRLGEGRPYFNLSGFLLSASHYSSSLYLAVVLGAASLVVLWALYDACREAEQKLGLARAGRRTAAAGLAVNPNHLAPALILLGVVAVLLASAARSLAWKLALVWAAGPLFAHLFLVRIPGTHYREVFPGLILLAATGAVGLYGRLRSAWERRLAILAGALFLVASFHYVYVAWLRPWPEYQLLYPVERHPLDWTNVAVRSAGGTFGAARRHGWKAVAVLISRGELPPDFATNERPAQAAWYLKRTPSCAANAGLYVQAPRAAADRQAVDAGQGPPGYALAGRVEVDAHDGLALYRPELQAGQPRRYDLEAYAAEFDRVLGSPWAPVGRLYRPSVNAPPTCG